MLVFPWLSENAMQFENGNLKNCLTTKSCNVLYFNYFFGFHYSRWILQYFLEKSTKDWLIRGYLTNVSVLKLMSKGSKFLPCILLYLNLHLLHFKKHLEIYSHRQNSTYDYNFIKWNWIFQQRVRDAATPLFFKG